MADSADAPHPELHDVFVSYASPDASIANELVDLLERQGLRCWIAPRDVAPGGLYADAIIRAINGAKVLVLLLSAQSVASPHVGKEIERASAKRRPILALRTDAAGLTPALEYFLSESQWIDVGAGRLGTEADRIVLAVRRLIAAPVQAPGSESARLAQAVGAAAALSATAQSAPPRPRGGFRRGWALLAGGLLVAAGLAYFLIARGGFTKPAGTTPVAGAGGISQAPIGAFPPGHPSSPGAGPSVPNVAAFAPPPHSVAVLPFVNMSGDPKQEYFSDGLAEEMLSSLTTIRDLQVAAQTSSFAFKGKNTSLADIAHALNVGAILEGSVRKDGQHLRINAQLIDAVTGFNLWSHTYDRDLKDVLKLQTEIATAVTAALQATLLSGSAAGIELGGTQNPQAFDAYLRGMKVRNDIYDKAKLLAAIADFGEAIRLDPRFAKAYALKAGLLTFLAEYHGVGAEVREDFAAARRAAEQAIEIAPELGLAHLALSDVLGAGYFDFRPALAEEERALTLSPNDATVLRNVGLFFVGMGRADAGVALARRSVALDQVNPAAYRMLSIALTDARRYRDALEVSREFDSLGGASADGGAPQRHGADALLLLGETEQARQFCESVAKPTWQDHLCLAIAYQRLQRSADAQSQLTALRTQYGDNIAYQVSEIYAQWGDTAQALDALETAYRLKDPGLQILKVDAYMDPLRKEPRFQAVLQKLDFPD
jgi:TolB-like protein/Tfp pilus assembly protein PilF